MMAELFGPDALPIDKFMRRLGLRRVSEESYEMLSDDEKAYYQAYADGVNDFVAGVDLYSDDGTARLLPPEFLTFGITKENWRPWHPVDSMSILRLISFHLSWNWMNDLTRESFRHKHPDLAEFAEELAPFHAGNLADMTTVLDDDDLKQWNQYSEQTLLERYEAAKEHVARASPKIHHKKNQSS